MSDRPTSDLQQRTTIAQTPPPPRRGSGGLLPAATRNWLSLAGLGIAAGAAVVFAITLILDVPEGADNPYAGAIVYLVVPTIFIAGLLLVPLGAWLDLRFRRHHPLEERHYPVFDLNQPRHRTILAVFTGTTMVVVAVLGIATTRAVAYMDTPEFCSSCHGVMKPEAMAYADSPHARVDCVQCHIGPGADWYVRSKLSGARQVVNYALNNYPRPIPAPIKELRPARETCEQCHWPEKFFGDKVVVRPHFADDEPSTGTMTTFAIRTGGGSPDRSSSEGIHWHMDIRNEVRYVAADAQRQQIPWVEVTDPAGVKTVYEDKSAALSPAALAAAEQRTLDCMDCHNRPTHVFRSPAALMDALLDDGTIDRSLPFIKREGVAALSHDWPDGAAGVKGIAERLDAFYRTSYTPLYASQRGAINRAVEAVQRAYSHNMFPEMKVDWRTYPNNIGHTENAGCFRCHDGKHVSASGKTISNSCDSCHTLPVVVPITAAKPVADRLPVNTPVPVPTARPPLPAPAPPAPVGQVTIPEISTLPAATATAQAPATILVVPGLPAPAGIQVVPARGTGLGRAVPHVVAGREPCLMCHAPGSGGLAVPVSHAGRIESICLDCHAPG
ncbi:MAG TPA: NapC/NirT family cytochrome c [Chloroflexota bacterium]|nr:NapC/NirT family cytochrome c [Chloroflexota bacterium]